MRNRILKQLKVNFLWQWLAHSEQQKITKRNNNKKKASSLNPLSPSLPKWRKEKQGEGNMVNMWWEFGEWVGKKKKKKKEKQCEWERTWIDTSFGLLPWQHITSPSPPFFYTRCCSKNANEYFLFKFVSPSHSLVTVAVPIQRYSKVLLYIFSFPSHGGARMILSVSRRCSLAMPGICLVPVTCNMAVCHHHPSIIIFSTPSQDSPVQVCITNVAASWNLRGIGSNVLIEDVLYSTVSLCKYWLCITLIGVRWIANLFYSYNTIDICGSHSTCYNSTVFWRVTI